MTTKKTIRNFLRKRFPKENDIINKGKSAGIPGGIFIQLKKAGLFSNGGEMLKPVNKEKNPGLAKLPEKVRNKMGYAKKGKMLKANSGRMAMIKQLRGKDLGPAAEEKLMKMPIQDLREKVREKKMAKAKTGMSVKGDDARDIRKVEEKIGASRSSKREKRIMKAALGAIALGAAASEGLKKFMKKKSDVSPAMSKKSPIRKLPVQELYQKATEQKKAKSGKMMKASMGKSVRGYGAARTSGMGLQDESLPPGKSLDYYKDLM